MSSRMYPLLLITVILIGGGFDLATILGGAAAAEAPPPSPLVGTHNGSSTHEGGPHNGSHKHESEPHNSPPTQERGPHNGAHKHESGPHNSPPTHESGPHNGPHKHQSGSHNGARTHERASHNGPHKHESEPHNGARTHERGSHNGPHKHESGPHNGPRTHERVSHNGAHKHESGPHNGPRTHERGSHNGTHKHHTGPHNGTSTHGRGPHNDQHNHESGPHKGSRTEERGPHRRHRGPRDFCGRSVTKLRFCPDPRTLKEFNAARYQGLWYEVGTSAKFKFEHELGQVCEHELHSLLVRRHGDHGAVMAVVRRGQPVLSPTQALGILRLAAASQGVCTGARGVCAMVAEHGPYDSTLLSMRTAVEAIRRSHPDLPQLSNLGGATRQMEELERLVVRQMDRLAADMARLQALNANISQQEGHMESNVDHLMEMSSAVDELVRSLSLRISETADNVRAEVSRDAAYLRPENIALAVRLEASVLAMDAQLAKAQAKLQQISAFLSGITVSARAFWAAEPPEVGFPGPALPVVEARGIAVQNPDALGKFQLHQYRSTTPYWLLDVENNANSTRYDAVLIYSCVENLDGTAPQENLIILSRNMTLDHSVFQRFMRTAKRNHINLDCENGFIHASQHHGTCSSWPST